MTLTQVAWEEASRFSRLSLKKEAFDFYWYATSAKQPARP